MKLYQISIERKVLSEIIRAVNNWRIKDKRYYDLIFALYRAYNNLMLTYDMPITVELTQEQVVSLYSALEHYLTTREFRNAMSDAPLYMGYIVDAMNDVMARLWDSLLACK